VKSDTPFWGVKLYGETCSLKELKIPLIVASYEVTKNLSYLWAVTRCRQVFGIVGEDGTMTFIVHIRDTVVGDLSWGHLGHIIRYAFERTGTECHGILRYGKIYEYSLFVCYGSASY
jgi:hypothetical protein